MYLAKKGKFPCSCRLRGKANFDLFKRARHFRGKFIRISVVTVPLTDNRLDENKVAFVVGKRTISQSVKRNKIKRRLREIYRAHKNILQGGIWLMLIALEGIQGVSFEEVERDVKQIFTTIASKKLGNIADKRVSENCLPLLGK